jgi:hypothetical protein
MSPDKYEMLLIAAGLASNGRYGFRMKPKPASVTLVFVFFPGGWWDLMLFSPALVDASFF